GKPPDALEPVIAAPKFPAPMWVPLRELSQELVLPGIGRLTPDSVTAMEANNRFVNSYMVGLNHELARRLLWNGFPTDQRATYFRQFWDPAARVPAANETAAPDMSDIEPLIEWARERQLAKGAGAAASGRLVLVVRGELLRR